MLDDKPQSPISSPPTPVRVTLKSLTHLLDISPDAQIVVNRAGTIVMVNEQVETLFGYAREELAGQQLILLLPESLHEKHSAHWERYFSAPRTRLLGAGFELYGKRKNSSKFPVDISLRPILLDKAIYVIGSVRDVTEQKRLEATRTQLARREQQAKETELEMARLRSLFSQAPVIMNIFRGPEHIFEFIHPLGIALTGGRDLTGMAIRDALPEIAETGNIDRLDRVYQTGETLIETEMPALLRAANGELVEHFFNSACQPWYGMDGKIAGVLHVTVEVTEQVRARRQLEESEQRFRALADAMPQMVWTAGPDGILDYTNQRWSYYTGMDRSGPAQGFKPALHPDDLQNCSEKWRHALKTGEEFEVECRYRRGSDGSYRWHLARALPVRNSKGAIIKWYGTTTDIDDQKRAEEALRVSEARLQYQARELERTNAELRSQRDELIQLNSALEAANRGRQFFSTMSHELRTPLASIIGFSQLLLDEANEAQLTHRQKNNLERILKNGQHLLNLINDVLDLVKIEAGRMEITLTQVDVRELLTWVVEETQSLAIARKLAVSTRVDDEISLFESSPVKMRQVLLNLVSNALRYTEHGEVTISARRVGTDHIAFAVKDTGIGIAADMQERIFEAFYQVDASYTRRAGGTGLGLYIVNQLTTLLGGEVELTSSPGQGSTFTVILPITAAKQQDELAVPFTAFQGE